MVHRNYPDPEMAQDWAKVEKSLGSIPGALTWQRVAFFRRFLMWIAVAVLTLFGAIVASTIFSGNSPVVLRALIVGLFSVLFGWLSYNFITAFVGFVMYLKGRDAYNPTNAIKNLPSLPTTTARVAVVMPIYNEDVSNVFARMETMYEALQRTSEKDRFTFFIISDTSNPDVWVNEEIAWKQACDRLNAHGRIIYRHRRSRVRRKSGNVADFCRRWGNAFDYMITLDSDSLMSASAMIKLAAVMDKRPDIGILQTAPLFFHGTTPLSRLQQFISHAYGPIFFRGIHFFQMGDASYWGHNAITRIAPFMKYGALPETEGKPPFGGMILSHDSIEAALMRRAGWGVWLAYDLDGSFEQSPATLALELERDHRWCRGNLQHLRFLGMKGSSFGHRWLFFSGNLFYVSSFLWLLLMLCTTIDSITKAISPQVYFGSGNVLFPQWPDPNPTWGLTLLTVTLIFLFLPKILGLTVILRNSEKRCLFGGALRLVAGFFVEILFSFLLAPIRMVYYSYFFATSLLGSGFDWKTSYRFAEKLEFIDGWRLCWLPTLIAVLWTAYLFSFDKTLFWWISLVSVPLIVSMPIAILVSHSSIGRTWERLGLLRIPPELKPIPEIPAYESRLEKQTCALHGFRSVLTDPTAYEFHRQLLGGTRKLAPAIAERRKALAEKAFIEGISALSTKEKKELLLDPTSLAFLKEKYQTKPAR
jgi:membrane glycosyltransferase